MNTFLRAIITPESVADRLAAAANLSEPDFAALISKQPRLAELLWFLQWTSMQPGGLEKFALDVVEQFAPMFGPDILNDESASFGERERTALYQKLPEEAQMRLVPARSCMMGAAEFFHSQPVQSARPLLLKMEKAQFKAVFLNAAREELCAHLNSLFALPAKWLTASPWYCDDLAAVLFEAMDAHASRAALQLAGTEIVATIFETLDFAWSQKVLVQIEGDSRFGKTEAVKAWCAMYPGRARLVSTPGSNFDRDIYKAVAESLGIQFSHATGGTQLKEKVEHVIRHCGLMFIFDEGHFLLPQRITRNTLPTRLNWARTQIIDRRLPVAIVATPQAFNHAVNKFTRSTGYNFEQFLGRIAHTATLPDSLNREDLLAIAKFHGPDLDARLLKYVIGHAMSKQSYIKAVENIIKLARWNCERAGRQAITLEDLENAASGRIHGQSSPAPVAPVAAPPRPAERPTAVKRGRNTIPAATPAAAELSAPPVRHSLGDDGARSITPATSTLKLV